MNDLVARWYEDKKNVAEMRSRNAVLKDWERSVIRQLPSGTKILDVGCGLGREAFALADLGFDVVGIDISKEAITQVAQLSADKGYTIPFLDYDGESLPFGDETFDVVVVWAQTFGLLYGNAAKQRYLTECKRVLRTGDLCSFSTHDYQFLKKPTKIAWTTENFTLTPRRRSTGNPLGPPN